MAFLWHTSSPTCVISRGKFSWRNKLRSIRLVWVTVVALQIYCKLLHHSSTDGHLTQRYRVGLCSIIPNQQFFVNIMFSVFIIDKIPLRAGFGLRAVVWRPLLQINVIFWKGCSFLSTPDVARNRSKRWNHWCLPSGLVKSHCSSGTT